MALTQEQFDDEILARLIQVRLASGKAQDVLHEIQKVCQRGDPNDPYNANETLATLKAIFKQPFNDALQALKDAADAVTVVP